MSRIFVALFAIGFVLPTAAWQASPEVITGGDGETVTGVVFEDRNGDGRRQSDEPGIAGVMVTNGLDVVVSDEDGSYQIAVRPDMDLSVVQPAGWQVPVDHRQVPQIHYVHRPGGSTENLRFGGLPDTGPAPARVNFPLQRAADSDDFRCAIIGDPQTYSSDEIGYFRHGSMTDLVDEDLGEGDCMIYLGDVVGDDLGLLDLLLEVGSVAGVPQWPVIGNHDLDLDATKARNASDTWRRKVGPNHYAFEIGQVTFVALNNIVFPCGERDVQLPGREYCLHEGTQYNGRVDETQMQWLANLLGHIDENRLIVLLHHVPLVSFVDADSARHQTDNAAEIHRLLQDRPALSLAGHTHTLENHAPGDWYEGWEEQVGVGPLPFRHIIVGAASGAWWLGDFDIHGIPMALQRMGGPKGVLMMAFEGTDYRERYRGARLERDRAQWVSLNTPEFRNWFDRIAEWKNNPGPDQHPVPPLSSHDLPDNGLVTREDLAEGVYVAVNFWAASSEARVQARLDGGEPFELDRTQKGRGEARNVGAEFVDPFSFMRTLTIARMAVESREGSARSQGYESFQGRANRGVPQPQGRGVSGHNMHLWRARLPEDLDDGLHVLEIRSTDRHGRIHADRLVFEVREERPPRFWRHETW